MTAFSGRSLGGADDDGRSQYNFVRGRRQLGVGLVLALLACFFPAPSLGESDAGVQVGGSIQDGGVVGDAANVTSSIHVLISGSILPSKVVHEAVWLAPADDAHLAEWAAGACNRIVQAYHAADYD